jgi:hypothetical protein
VEHECSTWLDAQPDKSIVFLSFGSIEEVKLGVEMRGYNEEVVKAEEVEEKVRWVMAPEDGRALRERAAAAKDGAAEALKEGGSSHLAFLQFLHNLDTPTLQQD